MNVAVTYLIKDNKILFLFKTTRNYYVGPGGKQDAQELIIETAKREFFEETGLSIQPRLAAISNIISYEGEGTKSLSLFAFYANDFEGELLEETREGTLSWHRLDEVASLPMFSGDKMVLLQLIDDIKNDHDVKVQYAHFIYSDYYKQLDSYKIKRDGEV